MMRISEEGYLDLYFSEQVYNPEDLSVIDSTMLSVELITESDYKPE